MMDAITISDQEHATDMARGSAFLLNAMKLERGEFYHRPVGKAFARTDFLWSKTGNPQNQWTGDGRYKAWKEAQQERVRIATEEKNRLAEANRVSRDPCPMCGVRGDIGCKHKRAA